MNGFFLFQHFGGAHKKDGKRGGPANFIAKQLDFDSSQLKQFEKINQEHQENIRAIIHDIKMSKDMLFDKALNENVDDLEIDAITTQIGNKEKAKDLETVRFFKAIAALCTERQRARFASILKEALHQHGRSGGKGSHGGGPPDRHGPPPK